MLFARKPFFLGGGKNGPLFQQSGRAIMIISRNSEYQISSRTRVFDHFFFRFHFCDLVIRILRIELAHIDALAAQVRIQVGAQVRAGIV